MPSPSVSHYNAYTSSNGLRHFMRAARSSEQRGLPAEMENALQQIEKVFEVSTGKLHHIVDTFETDLKAGLEADGSTIPMNLTWVFDSPSGNETGSFLALDLGGTNIRVCWITLNGRGRKTEMIQESYKLPTEIRTGDADALWSNVADSLQSFIKQHDLGGTAEQPLPFGFTFSYPATQYYIDHGILQRWTKGLDIKGVEGEDAADQLRKAMEKRNLPVRLVALINDTTGAMIASTYNDPATIAGAIFGTGCNAAYMEDCSSIPKLPSDVPRNRRMAINCEYGAFDDQHRVLPRTKYDIQIDKESPKPGQQTFEKLSAGHYLGEIFRLAILDLHDLGLVFKDQPAEQLRTPYVLDTGFLSLLEDDNSMNMSTSKEQYKELLNVDATDDEMTVSRRLAEAIAVRGARLCTCGIAAICRMKGIERGHVAADGSVANKHPKFKKRWADALGEVIGWPKDRIEDPITMISAEDGSGIGAAVIAAMTVDRVKKGDSLRISDQRIGQ